MNNEEFYIRPISPSYEYLDGHSILIAPQQEMPLIISIGPLRVVREQLRNLQFQSVWNPNDWAIVDGANGRVSFSREVQGVTRLEIRFYKIKSFNEKVWLFRFLKRIYNHFVPAADEHRFQVIIKRLDLAKDSYLRIKNGEALIADANVSNATLFYFETRFKFNFTID